LTAQCGIGFFISGNAGCIGSGSNHQAGFAVIVVLLLGHYLIGAYAAGGIADRAGCICGPDGAAIQLDLDPGQRLGVGLDAYGRRAVDHSIRGNDGHIHALTGLEGHRRKQSLIAVSNHELQVLHDLYGLVPGQAEGAVVFHGDAVFAGVLDLHLAVDLSVLNGLRAVRDLEYAVHCSKIRLGAAEDALDMNCNYGDIFRAHVHLIEIVGGAVSRIGGWSHYFAVHLFSVPAQGQVDLVSVQVHGLDAQLISFLQG